MVTDPFPQRRLFVRTAVSGRKPIRIGNIRGVAESYHPPPQTVREAKREAERVRLLRGAVYDGVQVLKDDTTVADNSITEAGFLVCLVQKPKAAPAAAAPAPTPTPAAPTPAAYVSRALRWTLQCYCSQSCWWFVTKKVPSALLSEACGCG